MDSDCTGTGSMSDGQNDRMNNWEGIEIYNKEVRISSGTLCMCYADVRVAGGPGVVRVITATCFVPAPKPAPPLPQGQPVWTSNKTLSAAPTTPSKGRLQLCHTPTPWTHIFSQSALERRKRSWTERNRKTEETETDTGTETESTLTYVFDLHKQA